MDQRLVLFSVTAITRHPQLVDQIEILMIVFSVTRIAGQFGSVSKGDRFLRMYQCDAHPGLKHSSKFIDSFFYRWAEDKLSKTVHYISLVTLEGEVLPNFSDEIARKLSPAGRSSPRWQRHPVQNCQVFNLETWNENFPKWPVTRVATVVAAGA